MIKACTACRRREPFFFRRYSGDKLCKTCFVRSIEDKVRATIARYDMLEHNDRTAVAFSSEKGSLSLLQILSKIERRYPKTSLIAVSVNEGIEEYSDKVTTMTENYCRRFDIEHHIVSFDKLYDCTLDDIVRRLKMARTDLTPCSYCSALGRKALNIAAREVKADKVATARTLDDQTHAILLNIIRGDLLGITREKPVTSKVHPKLVQRIKPFCEILEKEEALYAYTKKIGFRDASCPYTPQDTRRDIYVFLNRMEQKRAGLKFTLFKSIEKIRPAIKCALNGKRELSECSECGEPTTESTCEACKMLQRLGIP